MQEKEGKLHEAMPEEIKTVNQGKRLLLLKELLQAIGWPDKQLVPDLASGMRIAGNLERSGTFLPYERGGLAFAGVANANGRGHTRNHDGNNAPP